MKYLILSFLLFCGVIQASVAQATGDEMETRGNWYHFLHFQSSAGQTSWSEPQWGFGAEHVSGYMLRPWMGVGLGAGLNMLGLGDHKRVAPLFMEWRTLPFPNARHKPFFVLDAGYAWAWKSSDEENIFRKVRGGPRLHLAAGMQWKTRPGWELVTEFGYLRQRSELERNNFWWWNSSENFIRERHDMQRWAMRIGLGF